MQYVANPGLRVKHCWSRTCTLQGVVVVVTGEVVTVVTGDVVTVVTSEVVVVGETVVTGVLGHWQI